MIREYKTVEEISGPLMMVRMVENVTYDELVDFWGQFEPYEMNTLLVLSLIHI